MIADTIREFPVTLADIKREALKEDFIHTPKNKIYNKDPNVPEVFFILRRCPFIQRQSGDTEQSAEKKNHAGFSYATFGEKPH